MLTWKRLTALCFLLVGVISIFHFTEAPKVVAQAISIRPAMVRSVDEPARVPYFVSARPTCPFLNECYVTGGIVPPGKRLRVTRLQGELVFQTPNIIVYLSLDGDSSPLVMFPSNVFSQAFFGSGASFNQEVDFFFEAGQAPYLVVGAQAGTGGISTDPRTRLTIAGYLVDVAP